MWASTWPKVWYPECIFKEYCTSSDNRISQLLSAIIEWLNKNQQINDSEGHIDLQIDIFISSLDISFVSIVAYSKTIITVWSKKKISTHFWGVTSFYPASGHNVKKVRLKQQLFISLKYDFKCDMLMISVPGGLC